MKKLVIVVHGIGDHKELFFNEWEKVIRTSSPSDDYEVVGLYWNDVLAKVAERYPLIDSNFGDAVAKLGFKQLAKVLDSSSYKKVCEFFMDVLVYMAMGDMTDYIQTTCSLKLKTIIDQKQCAPENVILIGHSLGAAMLPHVVWGERNRTGSIPFRGLILLASPLAMESPCPSVVKSLLGLMPKIEERSRVEILRLFAQEWELIDSHRLHFLVNTHDIVCSDVKIKAGPIEKDFIFVRQGFSNEEIAALEAGSPGCVHVFTEGSTDAGSIIGNHDVLRYLKRPEFIAAFQSLIG